MQVIVLLFFFNVLHTNWISRNLESLLILLQIHVQDCPPKKSDSKEGHTKYWFLIANLIELWGVFISDACFFTADE